MTNFVDKLESYLLRPSAKVYYNVCNISEKNQIFALGCFRNNYGKQDDEIRKNGIISMMNKLRDSSYIDEYYTGFSLDLIGWDYFNNIIEELEPTNEDLFNLYKICGYTSGYGLANKLDYFLNHTQDKKWKIKFFKCGFDYTGNNDHNTTLKNFIKHLPELSDEEWIDALSAYLNNSIMNDDVANKENKNSLIEVCVECIKDNDKCESFIKKYFNKDINLSNLFIKNVVTQLKIDSISIVKEFNYANDKEQISWAFKAIYDLVNRNYPNIGKGEKIDFYNKDTEYSFIIYDDTENLGIETLKWLINEMMPICKELNISQIGYTHNVEILNDNFVKRLNYYNMSKNMHKKDITKKIKKI